MEPTVKTKKCVFCEQHTNPSYKDYELLRQFMSFRGKLLSREKTRLCAKHQRKLAAAVKQARTLALLPYVVYEAQ